MRSTLDEDFYEWFWYDTEGDEWTRASQAPSPPSFVRQPQSKTGKSSHAPAAGATTPQRPPSAGEQRPRGRPAREAQKPLMSAAAAGDAAAARGEGQLPPSLANLSSKNASSRPPTATPDAAADAPADAASRVRDPKLSTPAYLQSGVGMVGVRALLEKMRLEAYADAFDEAGYDDAEFVLALDGDTENGQLAQMMNDVGMKLGHKNKFFKFHKDIVATHNL